jgi:hypothetical protein
VKLMDKVKSIITILCIGLFLNTSLSYSLEVSTHEAINERIASGLFNGFSLDSYLKNNLGFTKGKDESVNGKKVYELIRDGGRYEDKPPWTLPYRRSVNHFHNPLTEQGFSGFFFGLLLSGDSSLLWAQKPLGTQSPGGYYSWYDARDYFYKALTLTNKTDREKNFSDTFRGIGQIMHLVEDSSVPAHTRNDGHLTGYEKWVENNININTINLIFFDNTILNRPTSGLPIANIFDTNQYNGGNPNVAVGTYIGLAEYTNANFFSEDTINSQNFPYPRIDSNTPIVTRSYTGQLGIYPRQYYLKNCCGETNAPNGYLLSVVDYFDYWRQKYPILSAGLPKIPVLDDNVYNDYASLLIPRAVGYSAGLLNYFFRGTLEITAPDSYNSYIYSISDGSITPQQFTRLKAKVRNSTPDSIPGEEIQGCDIQQQNCIIQAIARYKKRTDYQPDLSTDPPTASSREPNFSYSVSAPIVITSLSSTTPEEFTFDFTSSPIPAGITDLYLHVVFKGTLGNETDIAIAVGMKDINEPHHFSIWNATDRFYLDGVLRTASEIRNNPILLDRVDFDNDGIVNEIGEPYIDPYNVTTEIAFYPTGVTPTIYNATFTPLPSGRYGRIIILTDMPNFYIRVHRSSINPSDENTADFLFSGVTNQDINGTFQNTQVITFRGIIQHTWSAYARSYPDSTGISTAPWPIPLNTNSYPTSTMYP